MTITRNMLLALLSVFALITISVTANDVDIVPRLEMCGAPDSSCDACGAGYSGCGSSSCYNPSVGEICCEGTFVCPKGHDCGHAEGTCHQPTVTVISTTISTTATMTVTSTRFGTSGNTAPAPNEPIAAPAAPSSSCSPTTPPVLDSTMINLPSMPETSYAPPYYSPLIPLPSSTAENVTFITISTGTPQTNTTTELVPSIPISTSSQLNLTTSTVIVTPTSYPTSVHTGQTSAFNSMTSTNAFPTSGSTPAFYIANSFAVAGLVGWMLWHMC